MRVGSYAQTPQTFFSRSWVFFLTVPPTSLRVPHPWFLRVGSYVLTPLTVFSPRSWNFLGCPIALAARVRIKKPYHTPAPPRYSAGNANSAPSRGFSGMNLPIGAWNSAQLRPATSRACPIRHTLRTLESCPFGVRRLAAAFTPAPPPATHDSSSAPIPAHLRVSASSLLFLPSVTSVFFPL
jgi:hypothetical protein